MGFPTFHQHNPICLMHPLRRNVFGDCQNAADGEDCPAGGMRQDARAPVHPVRENVYLQDQLRPQGVCHRLSGDVRSPGQRGVREKFGKCVGNVLAYCITNLFF